MYSFALKPEEHQPSGTCNFSRIDNAVLSYTVSNRVVGGTTATTHDGVDTNTLKVYAVNYNVLRIMSEWVVLLTLTRFLNLHFIFIIFI